MQRIKILKLVLKIWHKKLTIYKSISGLWCLKFSTHTEVSYLFECWYHIHVHGWHSVERYDTLLSLKTIIGTHSLENLAKWIGCTSGVNLYRRFSMWEKADTCNLTRSYTCHYLHVYSKTWKPWIVWIPQNNNSAFTIITSSYVHYICASAMHAEPVFASTGSTKKVESQEYAASYHIMYSHDLLLFAVRSTVHALIT